MVRISKSWTKVLLNVILELDNMRKNKGTTKCEKELSHMMLELRNVRIKPSNVRKKKPNVTKELSNVILELHNVRMESSNVMFW